MIAMHGLVLFAMSLVASAIGGMLGMAGGVVVVPLFTASGIDIRTAIAASIVSVIACSCASAAPFLRRGLTNIRLAIVLELATTLGALTGVFLSGVLPTSMLFLLFAAILLLSAQQMLARRNDPAGAATASPGGWGTTLRLHSSYPDPASGTEVPYVVERIPTAMTLMYGAGLVSALLGIGSGVLKIPAMDTALRLPLKVSSATSNFMIGVTAAASAGAYLVLEQEDIVPSIPPTSGGARLRRRGRPRSAHPSRGLEQADSTLVFVVDAWCSSPVQMLLAAFGINLLGARR